jgi:uncharacterized membrane protein required for colicin V production
MINLSSLVAFDIVFIIIVGISILFGVARGFIKSALSLVGWIIAAIIAINFSSILVPYIEKYNFSHSVSEVSAIIITFIGAAIILAVFNSIIASLIKGMCGGLIDRSIGLTFGFVRGCVIACVIFYVLTLLFPDIYINSKNANTNSNDQVPSWAKDSKSLVMLSRGSDIIASLLPPNFKRDLKESMQEAVDENEKQLTFSTAKMDNIKITNKVLNSLPKPVLNSISDNDLIILQDTSAKAATKVAVLEKVANNYHQYFNQQISLDGGKNTEQYYSIMKDIENLITQYNSMINQNPSAAK